MTLLERMAEVDRLADGSRHSRECVSHAAQRAWNNDTTIADYPSPEATRAGLGYLGAGLTDCRCQEG